MLGYCPCPRNHAESNESSTFGGVKYANQASDVEGDLLPNPSNARPRRFVRDPHKSATGGMTKKGPTPGEGSPGIGPRSSDGSWSFRSEMTAEIGAVSAAGDEGVDGRVGHAHWRTFALSAPCPNATIQSSVLANVAGLYLSLRKMPEGPGTSVEDAPPRLSWNPPATSETG